MNLEDLPIEVLTIILEYLSLRDRNNARLSSGLLFQACNVASILNTEVLYCSSVDDVSEILETLINSRRRLLKLHFHALDFEAAPESFWNTCGSKIISLDFTECTLPDNTVKIMLEQCSKLEHLGWSLRFDPTPRMLCTLDLLYQIVQKKNVYPSLVSLELVVHEQLVSEYTLYWLLAIFPRIKKLAFTFYEPSAIDYFQPTLMDEDKQFGAHIISIIKSQAAILEKLKVRFTETKAKACFTSGLIMKIPNLSRLREVDLTFDCFTTPPARVVSFFSALELLQSATLRIEGVVSAVSRDLLLMFLEDCPKKLRHLEFEHVDCHNPFSFDASGVVLHLHCKLFEKIAKCHLVSLILKFDGIIFDENILIIRDLPPNYNLRSFQYSVNSHPMPSKFHAIFLETFPNLERRCFHSDEEDSIIPTGAYAEKLKHLELFYYSLRRDTQSPKSYAAPEPLPIPDYYDPPDAELQPLREAVKNVQLTSDDVPGISSKGLEKPDRIFPTLSFPSFKNLVYLKFILNCTNEMDVEFNLPALRYLQMRMRENENEAEVPRMIMASRIIMAFTRNLPNLEALMIVTYVMIPCDLWIAALANLKNLRFLQLEDKEYDMSSVEMTCFAMPHHIQDQCPCYIMYEDFFIKCPSLRALVHCRTELRITFYRSFIRNEVRRKIRSIGPPLRVPSCPGWARFG